MPSNHLIFCRPLLLLPSIFPSIRVFSSESVLRIRWPKYWSFSFNVSPFITGDWNGKVGSQEIPGVTGKSGLGVQNEAGQSLTEFCHENALVIANTLFQQYKRRLLRVPWTTRRSNQFILKEISPKYSLEGLMLKLNSNTLATSCEELTHLKRP